MANRDLKDQGSRKHVLDFVIKPTFVQEMNFLLESSGFQLAPAPHLQPFGRKNVDEWLEYEIEEYHGVTARRNPVLAPIQPDWWIRHRTPRNRSPTWDLISILQSRIEPSQSGILLVEAKANVSELKIKDAKTPPTPSDHSKENDQQIKLRIQEANNTLNALGCGQFKISDADHYQLANRLAASVHLANLGYRVVLLYLGFLGDTYFHNPIIDDRHWRQMMLTYLQGVVPENFAERDFVLDNGGSIRFMVRSLSISAASI